MQASTDKATLLYYKEKAEQLAHQYAEAGDGVARYFPKVFLTGSKVLDIGCGSGRDMATLLQMGIDAYGVDPCEEMRNVAVKMYPELKNRIFLETLPHLVSIEDKQYDGIICSAVLMHLPEEQLFDAAFAIRRVLREGGMLFLSIPGEDQTIDEQRQRDEHNRLFNGIKPEKLQFIFERLGFKLADRWKNEDSLGRKHRTWHIMSFRLHESDGSRSLDKIEAVLNKDKKVATYKPALFRALSELAMTHYQMATWLPEGKLALPISAVSEKWLEYYWPIFESEVFIQQLQGETESNEGKSIAFRTMTESLIRDFSQQGGLSGFLEAQRSKTLSEQSSQIYKQLIRKLNATIKDGPVKHSGGINSGQLLFSYDRSRQSIIMDADLWKELSMMGTWIQDATILRWAELTEKLSNHSIKASLVIDCLLTRAQPQRDVQAARGFYLTLPDSYCVWSEKKVTARNLAVDHAIPYSLWKNNDLWNLFPTDEKINANKSDKLPTRTLLQRRKELIIYHWEQMHKEFKNRFEYEAIAFAGRKTFEKDHREQPNWENHLFSSFSEAIEVTAIQRGVERWEPGKVMAIGTPAELALTQHLKSKKTSNIPHNPTQEYLEKEPSDTPSDNAIPILLPYDEVPPHQKNTLLPLVGKIAAGSPFSGFNHEHLHQDPYEYDWIVVPPKWRKKNRFIIQAAGDSMEPTIHKGDYLVCEYHRHQQAGHDLVIMADFSFLDRGVDAIKRISETLEHWIFSSDNPKYEPITLSKIEAGSYPILGTVLYNLNTQTSY